MNNKPLAFEAFEALADAYAAAVDTKPHNAYYERPATLSLLPEVKGRMVLDAGCGPGVYSEWLFKRGANVVSIDASTRMIELARQRLGSSADIRQANLDDALDFLESSTFDIVLSPLVLDYVEDWAGIFAEFYRVLRPTGHFIFSAGHPLFDYLYFKTENYFEKEVVGCEWKGFKPTRVFMPSYRRPLNAMLNPLIDAGFILETILEPKPTPEFKETDPEGFEELNRRPGFICVRARK